MEFITQWGAIAGFAGLALGTFLVLFREIISKLVFPQLTKKQSFTILILAMALVWSVSILSISFYFLKQDEKGNQVTVLVHSDKGEDKEVLPNRGIVSLLIGDAKLQETLNSKGEATFKQLPPVFFNDSSKVKIHFKDPKGEPYQVLNPDSGYTLKRGKYISVAVKVKGLESLRGVVKNRVTSENIENARVSILGAETYTNRHGEYVLNISESLQKKTQTIRVYKAGFEEVKMEIPIQTEGEAEFQLNPKD